MTEHTISITEQPLASTMTLESFAQWGLEEVAFIKQMTLNGAQVYAVHAANGQKLATAPARDIAAALVLQNELTPVDVH